MDAVAEAFAERMIKKVRQHISQNEALLFEQQFAGQEGLSASRRSMCRRWIRRSARAQTTCAPEIEGFPEVSEVEAIRHFTRLSTWNYAIDLRHVSAGLLHHEVQPADQRTGGAHRRSGVGASVSAGIAVARLHGSDGASWKRRSPKSPAWTRSRCSPPPARTASSPASC